MPSVSDTKKDWVIPPPGLYLAVCVDAVELGYKPTPWGLKRKIDLRWQTDTTYVDEETGRDRRYLIVKRYGATLDERGHLRPDLEAWRGRAFNEEELGNFELDNLIGVLCQLQIVHNKDEKGTTWANVKAIVQAPEGVALSPDGSYTRVQDRDGYEPPDLTPPGSQPTSHETDHSDFDASAEDDDIPF